MCTEGVRRAAKRRVAPVLGMCESDFMRLMGTYGTGVFDAYMTSPSSRRTSAMPSGEPRAVAEVGPVIDELRANGFFVREAVAQRILELAGER